MSLSHFPCGGSSQSYMRAFCSSLILSDLVPFLKHMTPQIQVTSQVCSLVFMCFPYSPQKLLMDIIPDDSPPPGVSLQIKLSKYSLIWYLSVSLSDIYELLMCLSNW